MSALAPPDAGAAGRLPVRLEEATRASCRRWRRRGWRASWMTWPGRASRSMRPRSRLSLSTAAPALQAGGGNYYKRTRNSTTNGLAAA